MKKAFFCSILLLLFVSLFLRVEANEAALDPPLQPARVIQPVPKEWSDSQRHWQGIPSLEVTTQHQLWAVWYSGGWGEGQGNYILLSTSEDQGETWTEPILAIAPPEKCRAFDPQIWRDMAGRLWIFWTQSEAQTEDEPNIFDGRAGVWAIMTKQVNHGVEATWSAPMRICDGVMLGKPIFTSDLRYLFPIANLGYGTKYTIDPNLLGLTLWETNDFNMRFHYLGRACPTEDELHAGPESPSEHQVVEKKDGSIQLYARTNNGISESLSTDGGKTFSDLASSKIRHIVSRFFIRRLLSGNLLLVKNGEADEDVGRTKLTAMISTDDGQTWSRGFVLDERANISYPDGNQAPDGMIYIAYDHDRYGEREICLARFSEEDILAGTLVNPLSRLKMVINKATGPLQP